MYFIYKSNFTNSIQCIIKKDNNIFLSIPIDNLNSDYQQYLQWIEEGNTPEPWNPEEIN